MLQCCQLRHMIADWRRVGRSLQAQSSRAVCNTAVSSPVPGRLHGCPGRVADDTQASRLWSAPAQPSCVAQPSTQQQLQSRQVRKLYPSRLQRRALCSATQLAEQGSAEEQAKGKQPQAAGRRLFDRHFPAVHHRARDSQQALLTSAKSLVKSGSAPAEVLCSHALTASVSPWRL